MSTLSESAPVPLHRSHHNSQDALSDHSLATRSALSLQEHSSRFRVALPGQVPSYWRRTSATLVSQAKSIG